MSRGARAKSRRRDASPVTQKPAETALPSPSILVSADPWWRREWFLGLFLVLATFLAYLPVWHAGFIWDDEAMLTDNPLVKRVSGLIPLWFYPSTPDYYPMTSSMLLVEWQLWGEHALGYHLVNVLLHAASAVFWWRILRRLQLPGAWLAAAIFAVHPVNVESVAWIAERKNTLSMFFYVSALLSWLRFESTGARRWYRLTFVAFVLALLSKTAVTPFPVVLLGLAWWRRGRVERKDLERTIPFFLAAVVLAALTIWFQAHRAIGHEVIRTDGFWSRLAGAGWAVWFYIYKALLPFNLIFVYPRWSINSRSVWSYLPLLLVLAMIYGCWRRRESIGRVWFFAVGYFILMLLPILGFINIYFMRYSLVADHWQYFAIIAPIGLAAAGLHKSFLRFGVPSAIFSALLLMGLAALTRQQCRMYTDMESLWRTTAERNPASALACIRLGQLLAQEGRAAEAIPFFQQTVEIDPNYADAHNNLGFALANQGRIREAIEHYQIAVNLHPEFAEFHSNLATVLFEVGRTAEAIEQYQKAEAIEPNSAEIQCNLGTVLAKAGKADEANPHFQKAMKIQPAYAQSQYDLGLDLAQRGRMDEAGLHFELAAQLQPGYTEAYINLGNTLISRQRLADAAKQYRKALDVAPDNVEAANNLALILATASDESLRNGEEAVRLAQRANQHEAGHNPLVLSTLAAAAAEIGRFPEAVEMAQHARDLFAAQSNAAMAETQQVRLKLYESGLPFHGMGASR